MSIDERGKGSCQYCNAETRSRATVICNHCYETKVRMSSDLVKARKILEDLEKEKKVDKS